MEFERVEVFRSMILINENTNLVYFEICLCTNVFVIHTMKLMCRQFKN